MKLEDIVNFLIKKSEEAAINGEIPVAAVIVDEKNEIISYGQNNRQKNFNVLGHAEINAILNAERKLRDWRLNGYRMYVTLEPCDMCALIIEESRLDSVYYIIKNDKNDVNKNNVSRGTFSNIEVLPEQYEKCKQILHSFFDKMR